MADGSYRFQQGAGQYYYQHHNQASHHPRHPQRAASPINNRAFAFNADLPSPTRSPGPQSPAHNPYSMFNQNHHQGQHVMMNGGSAHQRYAMQLNNMTKQFQHQGHQHQSHQQQHQDHGHGGHGGHLGGHQHNISSGGLSNATPHFASNHLQNGTPTNAHNGLGRPPNEHWALQVQLYQNSRDMTVAHAHARNHPTVNRSMVAGGVNGLPKESDKEERNRATGSGADTFREEVWTSLDLGGQRLKALSKPLFSYYFLTKLFLNFNNLTFLPPSIGQLRNISQLDVSQNHIRELPAEIGMLVNMREFLLFDNQIETFPYEMGSLYQLGILGIEGNPLSEDLKSIVVEHGTVDLIRYLREHAQIPEAPAERPWVSLDDSDPSTQERFTALSFNTLCDKYATQAQYGYTPSVALSWEHRKEVILGEVRGRNTDIVCLQEVETDSFHHFFREALAHNDYKGVFWPKSRARTMAEKEAKLVDGCATFFKNSKYVLLDKQLIDFANTAINRPDMKGEHDIFNRVMPRDDIAVVTFLENRLSGSRIIVVNAHIFWNPAYTDVKVVQVAILMEIVTKLADKYAKWPPCTDKEIFRFTNGDDHEDQNSSAPPAEPGPSLEYASGNQIPLIMCGDFNSTPGSGVYDLISHGTLPNSHEDVAQFKYGNFTRDGMTHPFSLKSTYSNIGELAFTNYTPGFTGVIDYIWYATNTLQVAGLLGEVDKQYLQRIPGFPNYHFPSDHLALEAELIVKGRKEKKAVEADFGQDRERRGA